jgi:hypothetical protein
MIARYRAGDQFTGNVERARDRFRKSYGFSHDDKTRVDKEIMRLYDEARTVAADEIKLPRKLVLAIILREGFAREAHRARRSSWEQDRLESAIHKAWSLFDKYRAQGMPKGEARTKAIRDGAAPDFVSESLLREQMGRSRYRHLRSMEPTHKV